MSNIKTFKDLESGPNRSPLPNPWSAAAKQPRGRATSDSPLVSAYYAQQQQQQPQGGIQYVGLDGYTHVMPAQELQTSPAKGCCLMCCPCCVDPCSEERKSEWIRLTQSFVFIVSLLQVIMFIAELGVGGFAPVSVNPMLGPPTSAMVELGAKDSYLERHKYQVFRFLTPIFLHAGFVHILFNLYAQLRFVLYLERQWGIKIIMTIYFIAGIAGNLFSSLVQPYKVSVGASGAIMGVMGGQLAQVLLNGDTVPPEQRKITLGSLVFFIVITMLFSTAPDIDWSAHLGGVLFGFSTAAVIFGRQSSNGRIRKIVPLIAMLSLVVFFVVGFALFYTIVKV